MSRFPHIYGDLSNSIRQIRTLSILPGVHGQRIQTELEVVHLDSTPEERRYTALSYTWGESPTVRSIKIGTHDFKIGVNLYDALDELRDRDAAQERWIDAICIDQSNTSERNAQVPFMKDIYQRAVKTVVWLGKEEDAESTRQLFEFMSQIYINRLYNTAAEEAKMYAEREWLHGQLRDPVTGRLVQTRFWKDIAQRRYWKRTWIVQEVCLSDTIAVRCGPNSLDWNQFAGAAFKLRGATHEVMREFYQEIPGAAPIEFIGEIRELRNRIGPAIKLEDLVSSIRAFEVTNEKDKVYGVLALAGSTSIQVDYAANVTYDDVCVSLVESCLATGSLDLITMRRYSLPGPSPASWVPDWRPQVKCQATPVAHPVCLKWIDGELLRKILAPSERNPPMNDYGARVDLTSWNAHGSRSLADATILRDPALLLTARGRWIGVVEAVGGMYDPDDTSGPTHFYTTLLNWERLMLDSPKFGNAYDSQQRNSLSDVFEQFLAVWDQFKGASRGTTVRQSPLAAVPSRQERYVEGGSVVEAFVRTIRGGRDGYWGKMTAHKYQAFWSADHRQNQAGNWQTEVDGIPLAISRRLVILAQEQIGLALHNVQKGDVVVVLYGCSIPVILRPVEKNQFNYVGDAYVHGLMDGAVVEAGNEVRFPEQMFAIK